MRFIALVLFVLLTPLVGCRPTSNAAQPTIVTASAAPRIATTQPVVAATAPLISIANAPPTAPPAAPPQTPFQQYRAWMEEARNLHPYAESVDQMWAVMLCESSGDPTIVSSSYYGLFQYRADTWAGDWNIYRDQPILDPRAQIFATAKAWQDGYQSWWGCY